MPDREPELDPEIDRWIDLYPAPDIDYMDVTAVRVLSNAYMADRGGPSPRLTHPDVTVLPESIGGVDVLVWSPAAAADSPIVIAMHGGAFIVGSALGAERIAVPLAANHGVTTVSVEYRLAPEHPAPAALDDCWSVVQALHDRGSDRQWHHGGGRTGDSQARIAVHGSSAGGCLAAGVALMARDAGIPIALQSLNCPALDHRSPQDRGPGHSMQGSSPTLTRDAVSAMWTHYLGALVADPADYVVPMLATDVSGVAPAHLVIAEHDVLRDEALTYSRRLSDAGVAVDVHLMPGTVHGFDGLLPESAVSRRAIDLQVSALARALRGGATPGASWS